MNRSEVEAVIRDGLANYSYHVSDECVSAMADSIMEGFSETIEKAWCYDEVSK